MKLVLVSKLESDGLGSRLEIRGGSELRLGVEMEVGDASWEFIDRAEMLPCPLSPSPPLTLCPFSFTCS